MPGHDDEIPFGGGVHQLDALLGGRGERLLDEDVLAGLERGEPERVVGADRRRDRDGVDRLVGEDLVELLAGADAREAPAHQLEAVRVAVADRRDLRALELEEVANEVRAPVTEPDDCDADGSHAVAFRWRRSANGVRSSSRRSRPSDQPRT